MALLDKFRTYLGTHDGRTSAAIVALTGAMLAVFVGLTFVDSAAPTYRVDFKGARWIQMAGATKWDAAYFRKSVYISGTVTRAWIAVSVTGNYTIFVNNILIAQGEFPGVRLTGIIDLKKILTPGKNVIAVYVAPGSYPGPPQLLVHGSYQVANSPPCAIDSDPGWKVAAVPDGIVGSYSWRSPGLDDRLWSSAIEPQIAERFSTVQPVSVEPRIFEFRPGAKWITGRSGDLRQLSFLSELEIPRSRAQTWMQIAASGAYDVVINGRLAASQPLAIQATVGTPMLSAAAAPHLNSSAIVAPAAVAASGTASGAASERVEYGVQSANQTDAAISANGISPGSGTPAALSDTLRPGIVQEPPLLSLQDVAKASAAAYGGSTGAFNEIYDITPGAAPPSPQPQPPPLSLGVTGGAPVLVAYDVSRWLSGGINSIAVRVRSADGPALLLVEGFTVSSGRLISSFQTDGRWRVSSYSGAVGALPGAQDSATVVASEETSPWGPLPQTVAYPQALAGQDYYRATQWISVVIAVTGIVVLLWLAGPLATGNGRRDPDRRWTCDALWHLPVLTALLILCLSCFDIRVAPQWCFTPAVIWLAAGFVLLGKLVVPIACSGVPAAPRAKIRTTAPRYRYLQAAVLIAIVLTGLAVRASGLLEVSFSHDEAKMAQCSWGVLKVGYPYFQLGSFRRWLTTYELIPYPLALSSLIFGRTVFAYRLPALVFGAAVIALIGWVGYRMMDWRAGLLSALIYAFLPIPIGWAQDGFYPSQESFFSLLTFWCFFEALRTRPLNRRYVTWTSIAFMLTYLSWEGSGFILPTLFVAIVVVRWGTSDWIKDGHLWWCFLIVSALVVMQLSIRQILLVPDYLGIVYDLSEITTPGLVFLSRLIFVPFYYIKAFFLAENQVLLSALAAVALVCFRKDKALLYLCTVLFTLEFFYTCFLPRYAPRYDFQATTLLVLAGTGSFIRFYDTVRGLDRRVPAWIAGLARLSLISLLVAFVLAANPFVLKLYRLCADPDNPAYFARPGVQFKPDYRAVHTYVARELNPDDAVVSRQAHVFAFYAKRPPDYSPDAVLNARMYYDGGLGTPHYIDKSWGVPSLRSLKEIQDIRSNHAKVWLVVAKGCRPDALLPDARSPDTPVSSGSSPMMDFDSEDLSYLETVGKVVRVANCQEIIVLPGVPGPKGSRETASRTQANQ